MKVNITLMALIRRSDDLPRVFSWDVEENTKIKTLLSDLGYNLQEIRMFQLYVTDSSGEAEKNLLSFRSFVPYVVCHSSG